VAFCDALLAARAAGKARIASLTADVERYRALSVSREQQRKELLSQVGASAPRPSQRPRTPARRRGGVPEGLRAQRLGARCGPGRAEGLIAAARRSG